MAALASSAVPTGTVASSRPVKASTTERVGRLAASGMAMSSANRAKVAALGAGMSNPYW